MTLILGYPQVLIVENFNAKLTNPVEQNPCFPIHTIPHFGQYMQQTGHNAINHTDIQKGAMSIELMTLS